MISYDGNLYSSADGMRSRIVEVRNVEASEVIARYSIPNGRGHQMLDPSHRKALPCELEALHETHRKVTVQRPLWFYDAVAQRLVAASKASL